MSPLTINPTRPKAFGNFSTTPDELLDRLFPGRCLRRILLVTPPDAHSDIFRPDTARRGRYSNYPPYGLALIATNLRDLGIDVRLVNLNHEILRSCLEANKEEDFNFDATWQTTLDREIDDFRPDLLGITCMFTMTHTSFKRVCSWVAGKGLPLAVGGVHVSNDLDQVIEDVGVIDIAFTNECDRAVKIFVQVVNQEEPVESLGHVLLIDRINGGQRMPFLEDQRPTSEEISRLPAFELTPLEDYSRYGTVGTFYYLKPKGTRFGTVLGNRGCRAKCTFCSVRNFNGKGVRERSIESVVDEIERQAVDFGIEHFVWLDDDLFFNHQRAIGLFNAMVKRRLPITWDASNGVLALSCTEEIVSAAEESGCIGLTIGMESGNPTILKYIMKPANVDHLLQAAEVLRRHERILSTVFLMLGFPGETMRMVWDTVRVSREMDLDWYGVSQLKPLPNTPLFDSMVEQGLIPRNRKNVRWELGPYGTQNDHEKGNQLLNFDFREAFSSIPLDAEPTREQLQDVWFFMNYHLNFHRIFTETRPEKVTQLRAILQNLSDVVAPEHGFAIYFLGYLEHAMGNPIPPNIISRLRQRLDSNTYWKTRLNAFGLSVEDLVTKNFPGSKNPIAEEMDPLKAAPAR